MRHLTNYQWSDVGQCINCDSLLTVKLMLGRERERYLGAPTVLLYKVTSSRESPSNADKLVDWAIGELIGLASNILVFFKRSIMYLIRDRISPVEFGRTSTHNTYDQTVSASTHIIPTVPNPSLATDQPPSHPMVTRSKNHIIKPKKFTDGTIQYPLPSALLAESTDAISYFDTM